MCYHCLTGLHERVQVASLAEVPGHASFSVCFVLCPILTLGLFTFVCLCVCVCVYVCLQVFIFTFVCMCVSVFLWSLSCFHPQSQFLSLAFIKIEFYVSCISLLKKLSFSLLSRAWFILPMDQWLKVEKVLSTIAARKFKVQNR